MITLGFPPGGQYLACLTLIDYLSSVVFVYEKDGGFEEYELQVPLKGDNSNQTLVIDQENP